MNNESNGRRIVAFGNCQAFNLSNSLNQACAARPEMETRIDFVDGNVPTALADLEKAIVGADKLIWQGRAEFPEPPAFAGPILRMPTIYFRTFWPFDGGDARIDSDPENAKAIPRGDTHIADLFANGHDADYIFDKYRSEDISLLVDLDQSLERETQHQRSKEISCDIGVADYIEKNMRSARLFSMAWHPTNQLLRVLEDNDALWDFVGFDKGAVDQALSFWAGDEILQPDVPIHPSVIRHFDLKWAPDHYAHFGEMRSFDDWLLTYLAMYDPSIKQRRPGNAEGGVVS